MELPRPPASQKETEEESFVRKHLLPDSQLVALQEVHGNIDDLRLSLQQFCNTHHCFFPALDLPHGQQSHAGVATLVAESVAHEENILPWVIVPDRAIEVAATHSDFTVVHINAHYFDFSDHDLHKLSRDDPAKIACVCVLHGDLN